LRSELGAILNTIAEILTCSRVLALTLVDSAPVFVKASKSMRVILSSGAQVSDEAFPIDGVPGVEAVRAMGKPFYIELEADNEELFGWGRPPSWGRPAAEAFIPIKSAGNVNLIAVCQFTKAYPEIVQTLLPEAISYIREREQRFLTFDFLSRAARNLKS
jgi:hypothetical protein